MHIVYDHVSLMDFSTYIFTRQITVHDVQFSDFLNQLIFYSNQIFFQILTIGEKSRFVQSANNFQFYTYIQKPQ